MRPPCALCLCGGDALSVKPRLVSLIAKLWGYRLPRRAAREDTDGIGGRENVQEFSGVMGCRIAIIEDSSTWVETFLNF